MESLGGCSNFRRKSIRVGRKSSHEKLEMDEWMVKSLTWCHLHQSSRGQVSTTFQQVRGHEHAHRAPQLGQEERG